jgi:hypothetical protein
MLFTQPESSLQTLIVQSEMISTNIQGTLQLKMLELYSVADAKHRPKSSNQEETTQCD